ncbi:MAG TPA: tetratricopeptide repeat protein [Aggregicoccus sp.]|nr:tetratricopeptide repeat protein [Aggregicoccus sp.]
MAAEQKPEVEKELGEIRKEVIEARNLVIKTDNLLKNLHAELKLVGKRQEDFQKRSYISSGVAYALFAILCIGAAVGISSASSSSATGERERLEKTVAELTTQMEKQRGEMNASQNAQRSAAEVYKLMTTLPGDERLKGIDALVKLDTARLSSLEKQALNDRAELLRREVGGAAFERGKSAFRRNDMQGVVNELTRFLAMNPGQADMLDASFFLGTAYNSLKKHEQAVPLLSRFVEGDKKSKTRDYAMLLLAQSLQETGQLQKGADVVRDAIGTYPNSEFHGQMRGRLATIKRAMNPTPEAAAPATAGAAPGQ